MIPTGVTNNIGSNFDKMDTDTVGDYGDNDVLWLDM